MFLLYKFHDTPKSDKYIRIPTDNKNLFQAIVDTVQKISKSFKDPLIYEGVFTSEFQIFDYLQKLFPKLDNEDDESYEKRLQDLCQHFLI